MNNYYNYYLFIHPVVHHTGDVGHHKNITSRLFKVTKFNTAEQYNKSKI